jgi:hypothetical protein
MKLIISLLLLFTVHVSAVIIEAPHFKTLLNHIDKDTLILLDIDDTLLIPNQMLGCDEWFIHRMDELHALGMPKGQALEKTIAEWESIRHITDMHIVEEGNDIIVQRLQDEGYSVMGLTTQGIALATRTHQQLNVNNFDLTRSAPNADGVYFSLQGHGVLYRNGVLFTSGRHKGKALLNLLKAWDLKPKHVVFINDKESHLKEVQESLENQGIAFTGLRYAFSDQKKSEFNWQIASYQFNHSSFQKIISDVEAALEIALISKN